jgi:hypothetical protein
MRAAARGGELPSPGGHGPRDDSAFLGEKRGGGIVLERFSGDDRRRQYSLDHFQNTSGEYETFRIRLRH